MVAGKEASPQDVRDTERLHYYWAYGMGAQKIGWGQPDDFYRCVAELGKYVDDPQGYCAKMHHEVLGFWPATHARMERDAEGRGKDHK